MRIPTSFAIAVLATLTACSHYEWTKADVSAEQHTKDQKECEYEADKATAAMSGNEFAVAFKRQDLISKCLDLRGYHQVKVDGPP